MFSLNIFKLETKTNRDIITTVPINYDIKDLFNQDDWEQINERYSCAICCELIHKKEWYQCANGHIGCRNCWNKVLSNNGSKQCPSCRISVQSLTNGLSRCRFIEEEFARKKVSCPYSFDQSIIKSGEIGIKLVRDNFAGCQEIIKIEQLDHHQSNCNSRFVKCNNDGCNNIARYNYHLNIHQDKCDHAIIKCKLCDANIKRLSSNHIESCPSAIISCSECSIELKRSLLLFHKINECPNTIIQCKFEQYGCGAQLKRSELSNHLQLINHTEFMIKQIDKQSEQLNQLESEIIRKLHHYELIYCNTWIISNYIERTKSFLPFRPANFFSPLIDTPHLQFKLSTSKTSNYYSFSLHFEKIAIEKEKIKNSFILLNCKDSSKNLINKPFGSSFLPFQSHFDCDISRESGFLFPDGSVHIEFTIYIERSAIQS